jgi:molecular chaperone GrpE
LNREEQQRQEGEPPTRDEPSREELSTQAECNGVAGEVSEPLEIGGSEDPGVVVPEVDAEAEEEEPETDPEEEIGIAREEILALAKELETVREERDEYLNDMRRMKAELENSRKRLEKERTRFVQLASERLVKELLPVLDNLERALEAGGDIKEGVRATRDQLVGILAREGLSPVASDGQSFDPAVHEAVMSQPSDEYEEGTIIQTFERGYVLNGKPIRPAKVVVTKQV